MASACAGAAGRRALTVDAFLMTNSIIATIAIFTTASWTCVGYLGRVKAQWIGSNMDWGIEFTAIIERIRRIGMKGSPVGLVLRINMEDEILETSARDGDVVPLNRQLEWQRDDPQRRHRGKILFRGIIHGMGCNTA